LIIFIVFRNFFLKEEYQKPFDFPKLISSISSKQLSLQFLQNLVLEFLASDRGGMIRDNLVYFFMLIPNKIRLVAYP